MLLYVYDMLYKNNETKKQKKLYTYEMKSTVKKRINFRNVQEGGNFFYVLREGKFIYRMIVDFN